MAGRNVLKDKAKRLDFSNLPGFSKPETSSEQKATQPESAGPKTAPGALMAWQVENRGKLAEENEALRVKAGMVESLQGQVQALNDELKEWDGANATRLLDPKSIKTSQWANRHEVSFEARAFEELKQEIETAGGNIQPIKVRPTSSDEEGVQYEVVFGHRRHRACLELGIPVLAMIENVDDRSLFIEMDRENRSREDLSPFEQGLMYQRALMGGLFPSQRNLAQELGIDSSVVSRALAIVSLPEEVMSAFPSPLEIQVRWGKTLSEALERDPEGVLLKAMKIKEENPRPSSAEVFKRLVSIQGGSSAGDARHEVTVNGAAIGTWAFGEKGDAVLKLKAGAITKQKRAGLMAALAKYLEKT